MWILFVSHPAPQKNSPPKEARINTIDAPDNTGKITSCLLALSTFTLVTPSSHPFAILSKMPINKVLFHYKIIKNFGNVIVKDREINLEHFQPPNRKSNVSDLS